MGISRRYRTRNLRNRTRPGKRRQSKALGSTARPAKGGASGPNPLANDPNFE